MGYDGRVEIVDAFKKIAAKVKSGEINPEDIDENMILGFLEEKIIKGNNKELIEKIK